MLNRFLIPLLLMLWAFAGQAAASAPRILVIGDSLSTAYRMDTDEGWVALLQSRLADADYPYQVINASITGETTRGGLARLRQALDTHRPSILIIELGGNDGLRGVDPRHSQENMQKMLELAGEYGSRVLLIGIKLPPNYGQEYSSRFEAVYHDLSRTYNIPLVPFFLDGVFDQPDYMRSDGIHPSAAGQGRLLDNVWPSLQPLL